MHHDMNELVTRPGLTSSTRWVGTQQLQTMPPLQRSMAWAPENTQDKLKPHSCWPPLYQQVFGTAAENFMIVNYIFKTLTNT